MSNEQGIDHASAAALRDLEAKLERSTHEVTRLKAMLAKLQQRLAERAQGEDALSAENAVYRAIFEAQSDLGEGFLIADGRKLVQVNPAFERMTGYTQDELLALDTFFELVPEDERKNLQARMQQRLSGKNVSDHYETAMIHKDGHRVNLEAAIQPIQLGNRPRILAIVRDISARKRMENALHQQNLRLQELDALKSSFISTVSHELRTPLATILGYGEFLDEGLGGMLSPEQKDFVSQILQGAKRLEVLVADLLDVARLESGGLRLDCQETDLAQKLREVAFSFLPLAHAKEISLRLDVPEEPCYLVFDGLRIAQVVTNLLANAFKFTPPGGQVVLRLTLDGSGARVEVRDNGVGISPEHHPYLFERFYQADPSSTRAHGGAGLGLPISKALIESHGGRIGVTSNGDRGSIFWFTLPLQGCPDPHLPNAELYHD